MPEVDASFVATRELFEHARRRVTVADIKGFAPNDPGYHGYVRAFTAILQHGEAVLSNTFDVTETIGLTRWRHATSIERQVEQARFRWFRILTCAADILLDPDGMHEPHYSLVALLVDVFAIADAGDEAAPMALLSGICREIEAACHHDFDDGVAAFCLVAMLLLADVDQLDDAAIEALCATLEERSQPNESQARFTRAASDTLLWGLTVFDQLHSVWLDLITRRFPERPASAFALKQRLLTDGIPWLGERRVLS